MNAASQPAVPPAIALYMALVQFLFVCTWIVYVIFLPALLRNAGLPPTLAPVLLIIDQLIFMAMDVYVGVAADRAQRSVGRVGPLVIGMTAVSCLAFLLLPHASLAGTAAPVLALALMLVWTTTSSALRAPPWVLLGKYAAKPSVPRMNALMLCGLAAGGALAPYLGVVLKNTDPRLPFAVSSLSLLAATAGIIYVERRLKLTPPPSAAAAQPADAAGKSWVYVAGLLLLATAFQIHYSINAAPQFSRLAGALGLEWLMPVFWIGFGIAMMPGSAPKRGASALPVMAVSAALGALGAAVCATTTSLPVLIAAQVVAGGAWGSMMMCAFSAALAAGRSGREGLMLGVMFAVFAAATVGRMLAVAGGAPAQPELVVFLAWMPAACWLGGGVVLGALFARQLKTK